MERMDAKRSRKQTGKAAKGGRPVPSKRPLLHEEVLAMIRSNSKEERAEALRRAGIMTKSGKLSPRYKQR